MENSLSLNFKPKTSIFEELQKFNPKYQSLFKDIPTYVILSIEKKILKNKHKLNECHPFVEDIITRNIESFNKKKKYNSEFYKKKNNDFQNLKGKMEFMNIELNQLNQKFNVLYEKLVNKKII